MRKRKVITRSGARVRGYFASLKNKRLIPWESLLERDALLVMEFDEGISSIREFQEEICVEASGGTFSAYPDFHTRLTNGEEEIVEVKADSALRNAAVTQRLSQIAAQLAVNGQRYRILAEAEIRKQPRLANLEILVAHRRPPWCRSIPHELENSTRLLLECERPTTLREFSASVGGSARVLRFIANGLVRVDLNRELDLSAVVHLPREDSP